jgi:GT2 family glycosyltransferase
MIDVVPVSVIIPTIGRPSLLATCLDSVTACRPRPEEVLVVDQSQEIASGEVVRGFADLGVRLVKCEEVGLSRGRNLGLREASNDIVMVTDDDCTVAEAWVGCGWEAMTDPTTIVTGQVRPAGGSQAVPSTKVETAPEDYTGTVRFNVLFAGNMVLNRQTLLSIGGFDERFGPSEPAEDNDLCYRWLKAGYGLRYEPNLVVWHHAWRTREDLEQLYVAYACGGGFFYAKHLRQGRADVIPFLLQDLKAAARGLASAVIRGRPRWTDYRRGLPRGLAVGFLRGWRTFGPAIGSDSQADDDEVWSRVENWE